MIDTNNIDSVDLFKLLETRYSCRAFLKQQVLSSKIEAIIKAASRAPSWCNAQPWHVFVTKGEQTKKMSEALLHAAQNEDMQPDFEWPTAYTGEYKVRRQECGFQLYESVGIDRKDYDARNEQMLQNYKFFGAPHVAIITTDADLGPYGAVDCGGFTSIFTLVARALGIATVVQASVPGFAPTIRRFMDIPEDRKILTAISFGYEDPSSPINNFRTSRAPIESLLTVLE